MGVRLSRDRASTWPIANSTYRNLRLRLRTLRPWGVLKSPTLLLGAGQPVNISPFPSVTSGTPLLRARGGLIEEYKGGVKTGALAIFARAN